MFAPQTVKSAGAFIEVGVDGTYLDLDLLSGTLPDLDLVLLAHMIHDVLRQFVASGVDGLILDDTTERDDSDLRRTTTDVHDHVAFGGEDVDAYADSCSHGLVDHVDVTATSVLAGVAYGTDLYLRAP